MTQTTKQQLDAMAVADSLRPTLLRLARELRREKIAGVSPHQVGLLVAIKYAPGVTVGELAAEERVSTAAMSKRVSRLERYELDREERVVEVEGSTVRVKVGLLDGRVVNLAPEHDDCAAVAMASGRSVKSAWAEALARAQKL